MKTYLLPIFVLLLLYGCRNHRQSHNTVHFTYNQFIEGYAVSGIADKNSEFECYDLTLIFRHIETGQEFSVYGGRAFWDMETVDNLCLDYPNNKHNNIVESPDAPFFFADLDFDGKDELITDLSPYGGSQRDVGAFTCIYKIERGKAIDVTENFTRQSEIFKSIDQYYFMVNNSHKEIILYNDGGAINFGWDIYKFDNGEYRYDRYIHCEKNSETNDYKVAIISPQKNDTF